MIALDVDGVLNAGGSPDALGEGWRLHRVEIPAERIMDSPFTAAVPDRGMALTVCLNASLHGLWITRMRQVADVVWASTWKHAANYALPPLFGIDPLPVGISVLCQKPHLGDAKTGNTIAWKRDAMHRSFPDRMSVWIDDGIYPAGWDLAREDFLPRMELPADPRTDPTVVRTLPPWAVIHENVKNWYRQRVLEALEAMDISVDFQDEIPDIDEWRLP
ncbi:hypothetical protein [Nesterenkonia ebinurensis]|uniref:hypothetical protein n=1 Tax=Nesterenkonia ebinurensis TaxID=2608252 RepID=UPI00123CD46B|nr:hypothetical protein [Nesterenkonia ebinurensis]